MNTSDLNVSMGAVAGASKVYGQAHPLPWTPLHIIRSFRAEAISLSEQTCLSGDGGTGRKWRSSPCGKPAYVFQIFWKMLKWNPCVMSGGVVRGDGNLKHACMHARMWGRSIGLQAPFFFQAPISCR